MVSLPRKWRITVTFENPSASVIIFYIYDDHFFNMLTKLSNIHFDIDPHKVEIDTVVS